MSKKFERELHECINEIEKLKDENAKLEAERDNHKATVVAEMRMNAKLEAKVTMLREALLKIRNELGETQIEDDAWRASGIAVKALVEFEK